MLYEVITGLSALGCNELLNLSRGDVIYQIHKTYLEAGSDIITTNTFCGNAFNLAEYGLSDDVEAINLAACEIAREAAADYDKIDSIKTIQILSEFLDIKLWGDIKPSKIASSFQEYLYSIMPSLSDSLNYVSPANKDSLYIV